jgi:type VI secretion system protein ImpJ
MPQLDPLPAPLDVPADTKGEVICLALPLQREGLNEVDFGGGEADALSRFDATEETVRDNTDAQDEPTPIQTGRLRLRLLRLADAGPAYAVLGVVRVQERRGDGQVTLDRDYIAPQLSIEATAQLSAGASLLHGLVLQRAQALASRMGQMGKGVSEVADFLMLQTLNRNEPVLAQHAASPTAHPREFHGDCLRLAGDLATFSTQARRPPAFPPYRHDDLRATFAPVFDALRRALTSVLEQHALQVELVDRSHGVRTAVVGDLELVRNGSFVLAVNAQLPAEQLRQRFPAQTKLGPVEKIRDLVNLQLPGIALRPLPVAPRQLPFHAGFHYFELERAGELWKQIEGHGSMAMHVAGDFPGLELELWVIRQ